MKKRILAMICAAVMVYGMSFSVFAATSANTESVTTEAVSEAATESKPVSTAPVAGLATATQQFSEANLVEFAKTTTIVAGAPGATITAVSVDTAKAAIAQAKAAMGTENVFVASVVDLSVPAGTGAASFTLSCPAVLAGQNVTVLHQKADGTWESIVPTSVDNGAVTFTMTSYSPVAIVINVTAPKTGEIVMLVLGMAALGLGGTAIFTKKARA